MPADGSVMPAEDPTDPGPKRLRHALRLVHRRYWRQARARPSLTTAALLLPGIGNIFVAYLPPLVIANILGKLARGPQPSGGEFTLPVLLLVAAWVCGEVIWRFAGWFIARAELRGMEALYIEATGDTQGADTLSYDAMRGEIEEKGADSEYSTLLQRIAMERAGMVPPPIDLSKASAFERMFRANLELGSKTEQALAKRLGPERAREIRGDGWDSRSVWAGCPDDGGGD